MGEFAKFFHMVVRLSHFSKEKRLQKIIQNFSQLTSAANKYNEEDTLV